MTRARAAELALARPAGAAAPRAARGPSGRGGAFKAMGGDVKLLLATGALVLLAGVLFLLLAPPPTRYPAVLGYVDAGPRKVAQQARETRPPFKLPWWK